MNDIINWIALNNTLMIRIGFSAVVLLLVVYVFRFFFMPNISVVENAVKGSTIDKASSDMNIEELAELQAEIDTLKVKLKELQTADKSKAETAVAVSAGGAGVETVSPSVPPAAGEGAAKELKEKIKVLESRLTEYEIIAEEIAEIGKLKQENQKLKEQLDSAPQAQPQAEKQTAATAESKEPLTNASDKEIDELLGAGLEEAPIEVAGDTQTVGSVEEILGATEADSGLAEESAAAALGGGTPPGSADIQNVSGTIASEKPELFILHSEVEVTEEEKELINSFEDYKKV